MTPGMQKCIKIVTDCLRPSPLSCFDAKERHLETFMQPDMQMTIVVMRIPHAQQRRNIAVSSYLSARRCHRLNSIDPDRYVACARAQLLIQTSVRSNPHVTF